MSLSFPRKVCEAVYQVYQVYQVYVVFGVTDVASTLLSGDTMTVRTMALTQLKDQKRIMYYLYFKLSGRITFSVLYTQFKCNVKQIFSDGRWRIVLPKFTVNKNSPVLNYSVITIHPIFI
jgi:hypothetical protein